MSLMSLPNELLIHTAKSVCMLTTSGLLKCNQRLRNLLITEFFRHIQDFHPNFYARVRNAKGDDISRPLRVRAERFLRDIPSEAWKDDGFTNTVGWLGPDGHAAKALLNPKTLLNPQSCISLIDVSATNNPLGVSFLVRNLNTTQTLLNLWIHPRCLLAVSTDYLKMLGRNAPVILELLKNHGVEVDFRADDLRKAICDQDESTVERLLQQGVGRTFPNQCMFFSQAIPTGNAQLVELLFKYNVTPAYYRDKPLEKAVSTGKMEILELLLNHDVAIISGYAEGSENALHKAVLTENIQMVKLLLKYNVRLYDDYKVNAENIELLELLLENNIKPSCNQPYTQAILKGRKKLLQLLVKNNVLPRNEKIFINAIREGNKKAVHLAFKYGVPALPSDKGIATKFRRIHPDTTKFFQEKYMEQKGLESSQNCKRRRRR